MKKSERMSEEIKRKISNSLMGHSGTFNRHHTIETKQKISIANKGRKGSFKGKHHSLETKIKISMKNKNQKVWNKGKPRTLGTKQKISIANRGRKRSEEVRQKMSESFKGRIFSKKHKQKLRVINLGRRHVIETKRKMRLSALKRIFTKYGQTYPNYNTQSIKFFNLINRTFNLIGQHAENGGEYFIRELGFWTDYYESNNNLVIEFNEENHYGINGLTKKKYSLRQFEVEQFLGCIFINVRERDYQKNPFMVLSRIKQILGKQVIIKRRLKK